MQAPESFSEHDARSCKVHARAAEVTAALIDLAMRESQLPVEEISGALERIARALASHKVLVDRHGLDPACAELLSDIDRCRSLLARDVSQCVESLQFHDRLMQQLAHVRNCLAALALDGERHGPTASDERSWDDIRARLRARMISDAQRALLDLLLPDTASDAGPGGAQYDLRAAGGVELFDEPGHADARAG